MKDRSLKIGYGIRYKDFARMHQKQTVFPKLNLSGRWMEKAGFEVGDRVRISVEFGKLVIEKEGGQIHD